MSQTWSSFFCSLIEICRRQTYRIERFNNWRKVAVISAVKGVYKKPLD